MDILLELIIIYSWIIGITHRWVIIGAVVCADIEFWKSDSINYGYFTLGFISNQEQTNTNVWIPGLLVFLIRGSYKL